MGAPMKRSDPIWFNPCGNPPFRPEDHSESLDSMPRSPYDLLKSINSSARNALTHAQSFRTDWVRKTFQTDVESHHRIVDWEYDWLPKLPKKMGELVHHKPDPEKAQLDEFLVNTYQYLQQIAVGLEQVHKDMDTTKAAFTGEFWEAQHRLRLVLCEVLTAIDEQNPTHNINNIGREIMPDHIREPEGTAIRNMRDWIIFRDYMNCLEYIIQISEYFMDVIKTSANQ